MQSVKYEGKKLIAPESKHLEKIQIALSLVRLMIFAPDIFHTTLTYVKTGRHQQRDKLSRMCVCSQTPSRVD